LELGSSLSVDADELSFRAFVFEFHKSLDQCKQRIVLTAANTIAGLPLCTALASQDIAAEYMLAAEFLEAKSLCI
jgi:hypothetical protein